MRDVEQLLHEHGLKPQHIYLLELIPLIEMIWADGVNQEQEVAILQRYALKILAALSADSGGVDVISVEDVNEFIDQFTQTRPPAELLSNLRALCLEKVESRSDAKAAQSSKDEILNFCFDIAAACASQYPHEFDERIVQDEKDLLKSLMMDLTS